MPSSPPKIRVVGDPVLHAPARQVTDFDADLAALIEGMFAATALAQGVGLAAPQVGVSLAVFVYDCPDETGVRRRGHVINPSIETSGATELHDEGCLSVPGPYAELARAERATVRGVRPDRGAGGGERQRVLRPLPAARGRPPQRGALHRPPAAQPAPARAARHDPVRVERLAGGGEQLGDLHRVERGALAQVVVADEQREPAAAGHGRGPARMRPT